MSEALQFIVDSAGIRLDLFLSDKLEKFSRSKIQTLIKKGNVKVNSVKSKPSYVLKGGEIVDCVIEYEPPPDDLVPEQMDLDILYEDEFLAVINKPAGLVVHPGSGNFTGTLANGMLHHFQNLSSINPTRPGIVHRLDKDTTGVIVIAKTDFVHHKLGEQFANREVRKVYKALVWGKLENSGKISGLIGRHPSNRLSFAMVKENGRESLTNYEMQAYYPPISLVNLYPKTGRTHQLRVHLQSINHPILGDDLYSGGKNKIRSFHEKYSKILNSTFTKINRFALHAFSLEITHPETGVKMEWETPLPNDMLTVMEILKNG
ncbi:MAG: RluA family pseudouridine synthase [Candidatus Marinimicrobia bacterium]|nr:RluA family pseudouridine synthase [Candidatus Neomarinimicrobiota bacterium]MBL7023228.1 RluA family pseudouridine synthase [Candidatus Neomarinimicrobiota bacterium]